MKQYIKTIDGVVTFFQEPLIVGDKAIYNASEEQILAQGWEEYTPEPSEEYQPTYEEKVVELIRQRYSVDDEIAILRQKDTKADEFDAWYAYCEQCKQEARELGVSSEELGV